ncbi:ribonuclease Z [Winogradskyella psychrotolerans]|uniref:ribonuclease Z n=1 Tax=Winogradskyella psychrotolerans TaxID=1344585 RepID=UPI001C06BF9C|nr:ribonuclease Z [Winogradskyella psychrotolerans]MBU2927222.1 ribonuclease Z [Winogradskyella psychrotolerans]
MIIDKDGNVTIITQEKVSIVDLVKKIEADYDTYKHTHLIINLTSLDQISLQDVIEFLRLSNTHRSDKKSFVLVSEKVDLNDMPDEIVVVPTMQEAFDIIEMEDIERDLDF